MNLKRTKSEKRLQERQAGFTLVELLATISVAAVCGYTSIMYYPDLLQSYRRLDARTLLVHDIRRAQAEAITAGCRGILNIASDSNSYSYGCDYLAYDTATPPVPDSTLFVRNLPKNITISGFSTLIFDSRGRSVDPSGIMTSVAVHLMDTSNNSTNLFATGTLLGTGAFSFGDS